MTMTDASLDNFRDKVSTYGLVIVNNEGKGNCMFHALSHQLSLHGIVGDTDPPAEIRNILVQHVRENKELYRDFVDDNDVDAYCEKMAMDGDWGDNIMLQAAAYCYNKNIRVIEEDKSITEPKMIVSHDPNAPMINVGYVSGTHYVSLIPQPEGEYMTKCKDIHCTDGSGIQAEKTSTASNAFKNKSLLNSQTCHSDNETSDTKARFPSMSLSKFCTNEKGKKAENVINEFMLGTGKLLKENKTRRCLFEGEKKQESSDRQPSGREDERQLEEKQSFRRDNETPDPKAKSKSPTMDTTDTSIKKQESSDRQPSGREEEQQLKEKQSFRRDNETPDPKAKSKSPTMDTTDTSIKELELTKYTKDILRQHPSRFHLKVYVISSPSISKMTLAVKEIVREDITRGLSNISKSYIFFFYRDIDGPEIYVMTSGQAYRFFKSKNCPQFPMKIAKRLLQFKPFEQGMRNVTGDTRQTKIQYPHNWGGTVSIWDVIDAIVQNFKAYPRENSSIYKLACFTTKKKEKKNISISIKSSSVEVNQQLAIQDMLDVIQHCAIIDQNKPTYQCDTGTKEEDDKQFEQFKFIQEESDQEVIKILESDLLQLMLQQPEVDANKYDIPLSMPDLQTWHKAHEFQLLVNGEVKESWEGKPPMLSHILRRVQKTEDTTQMDWTWLRDNVKLNVLDINGGLITEGCPVTTFLAGHISRSSETKPCVFWHGKWLKINVEFLQMVQKVYISNVKDLNIEPSEILPLPWVSSDGDYSNDKLADFLKDVLSRREGIHTDDILRMRRDFKENMSSLKVESKEDTLALIFHRLHSNPDENQYNFTYKFLDQVIGMTKPKQTFQYIVGDKICCQNIEMFDILLYSETHTYLIHVKDGLGQHVRDACSQVKNSAYLLYSALMFDSTSSVLNEMWSALSDQSKPSGENMKKLGEKKFRELFMRPRQIVYVLAIRDKRDQGNIILNEKNETLETALKPLKDLPRTVWNLLEEQNFVDSNHLIKDKLRRKTEKDFSDQMTKIVKSKEDVDKKYRSGKKNWKDVYRTLKSESICDLLKEQEYVDKDNNITNKYRVDINSKDAFVSTMVKVVDQKIKAAEKEKKDDYTYLQVKERWKEVYDILRQFLPKTNSMIAQLEIAGLFRHFRSYMAGQEIFQLKICFLCTSNRNLGSILKEFLKLDE